MAKVEIPKGLLVGLAGVAAAATLGLVFLLGRETGRRATAGPQVQAGSPGVSAPPPKPAIEVTLTPQLPARESQAPGTDPSAEAAQPSEADRPGPSAPPTAAPPQAQAARAAVAAYFKAVDDAQPDTSGNPEAVAQQVVAGLGKGDTSGFDEMIQQAQRTRNRMAAIAPPQPCAAFHRESLASLDAGLDLMRAMKKALASSEPGPQVASLTDQANAMKTRSEALQAQEAALRQRFGLTK